MHDYTNWDEVYRKNSPEELPWELGKPRDFLVELIESGKIKPEGRALDICSGLGTNTIYLAKSGFKTSAIEISDTAVKKARENAREAGVAIDFKNGNVLNLPFGSSNFDFVLDIGCFHHMHPDDRPRLLEELMRVLKPGARLLMFSFSDKNGPALKAVPRKTIRSMFSPGFTIDEMRHLTLVEGTGQTALFNLTLMTRKSDPVTFA